MKLIRWLIGLALVGALAYVAVAVPLGDKTLIGHLRAIAQTREGQQLVEGVKQKAGEVKDKATGAVRGAGQAAGGPTSAGGQTSGDDGLNATERELLRKLIREKLGHRADKTDKTDKPDRTAETDKGR